MANVPLSGLLKVDAVVSVAEARALEAAGATIIGIDLAADEEDPSPRIVSLQTGQEIRASLTKARLCVTLNSDLASAEAALADARSLGADMVQVPGYGAARAEWREAILASGLPIVLDGQDISYEDDPELLARRLTETRQWHDALVQFRLLDDIEAPWTVLTVDAPEAPDEYLQLSDIQHLTETYSCLVTMDVLPGEVASLRAALPASKGLYFRIAASGIPPILALLAGAQA